MDSKDKFLKEIEDITSKIELNPHDSDLYYKRGNSYRNIGEHTKAIEDYNKAIELKPDYAEAYNYRGFSYDEVREYAKAIQDYSKAIELKPDYAYAYNNRGISYRNIGEYTKAIEDYNKALNLREKFALAYSNLGFLYKDIKVDYEKAKENFEEAREIYEKKNNKFKVQKMDEAISELDEYISAMNRAETEDLFVKIIDETREMYTQVSAKKSEFLKFIKPFKVRSEENFFKVLRRWNSYTPIVADNYHISKGGGYFLKINGKGIVIDPGFNFIENFKGEGHKFDEIDIILISHSHNDHTADLESILTLLHKYNENVKISDDPEVDTIEKDVVKKLGEKWESLTKKEKKDEVEEEFKVSSKRKVVDIYMTTSTFKKYVGMFDLYDRVNYNVHIIENGYRTSFKEVDKQEEFEINVIKAKHYDIVSDNSSVGFTIKFNKYLLIYTGDTGVNKEIEDQYYKIKATTDEGTYIILLAHLGGFEEEEAKYNSSSPDFKHFYPNHLGRLGLVSLVSKTEPQICVISEFGEEFKENRISLTNSYKKIFGSSTTFIPADIGLKIKFTDGTGLVEAISRIDVEKYSKDKEYSKPEDINACLLRKDYSLHYYDRNANFTEGDLIQVLIEEYDKSSK